MIKERIDFFVTKHWGVFEKVATPVLAGFFSAFSIAHEGNRSFLARQAYREMEGAGEAMPFLRGTGRILSKLGHKEVENALLEGRKAYRARYYEGIPEVYWAHLDNIFQKS